MSDFGGATEPPPGPGNAYGPNTNGCEPSNYQPQKCPQPGGAVTVVALEPQRVKPATFYYHPDHLGSTSWMTDQYARVHEHLEYFPYGEVWRENRGDRDDGVPRLRSDPFLFTGKVLDPETGLTYFGARYYDSKRATWIGPDPLLFSGHAKAPWHLSPYLYSRGNPIRYIDPDGWQEQKWEWREPNTWYPYVKSKIARSAGDGVRNNMPKGQGGTPTSRMLRQVDGWTSEQVSEVGGIATGENFGARANEALAQAVEYETGLAVEGAKEWVGGKFLAKTLEAAAVVPAVLAKVGRAAKGKVDDLLLLKKQLASESQAAEILHGQWEVIAGAGTSKKIRDVPRLVNEYGGEAADWAKIRSSHFKAADGASFETHGYQNVKTDKSSN